ncbi:MAG: SGNH/GDSL hydrolase family protein [Anaerolineales bacterium]
MSTPTFDLTTQVYSPENSNIQYTGRIDFSNPQEPKFSAPGVIIQARFCGVSAAVLLEDEFRWGTYRNYFDVLIDGVAVLKLAPQKSVTRYAVVANLPDSEHTIALVKRTEACVGYTKFLGFEFAGEILPAPARPARRIEVIGDSISCGSGNEALNESPQCLEDGWGQPYCNARLAYGPVLARKLNAECHLTAVSGIGLVRNYSFQFDSRPLPDVYDLLFVEHVFSPRWDHTKFIPDAVVVALGSNDFSPGESERCLLSQDVFVRAYTELVQKLRGYYPDAHIFCISSPMLHDGWPEETNQFATDLVQSVTKVADEFNKNGDAKVHKFLVKAINGTGCGTHPSVEQHADTANELEPFIATVMGW